MKAAGCLLVAILLPLLYVVSILILMHGWGLEPQSWTWIGGGVLAHLVLTGLLGVARLLMEADD